MLFFSLLFATSSHAQFYRGSYQEFGKNRVQYDEFIWFKYKFEKYNVYFYAGGKDVAIYTARNIKKTMEELEEFFDYYIETRIHFVIYNKLGHYRQSNIGLADEDQNIGGVTRIAGSKVFLYYEGVHAELEKQIRAGISEIIINHMMFGDNWKEVVKNSTLLTLPDWYVNGLVSYASEPWSVRIDNRVRDGIMTGKYEKFNRLSGIDAKYAGHSLWHYIAENYGHGVIPNILYMSRISRNIESGFLFVLGVSLKTLMQESLMYYKSRYEFDDEIRKLPDNSPVPVKVKKNRVYSQLKISPDGNITAFVTNQLGKYKVWMVDNERGKKRKVTKGGFKLDRITDHSFPLLAWHPGGEELAVITEKKGQILLTIYSPENRKKRRKPIFKLEKVLDFSYSDDGKKLVFSAISKGQTDIYVYKVASNVQERLTNDLFDDLNPRFINNSQDIIFSSNRDNDTLSVTGDAESLKRNKDVFIFHYSKRDKVLSRATNTPESDENYPAAYDDGGRFTYLSDENGIVNRYLAHFDSIISHIDTAFHYRYFTKSIPITNYSRNIIEHDINLKANKYAEIVYVDGKYRLFVSDIPSNPMSMNLEIMDTEYREIRTTEEKMTGKKKEQDTRAIDKKEGETQYSTVKVFEEKEATEEVDPAYIDINNYEFEDEKEKQQRKEKKKNEPVSRFITLTSEGRSLLKEDFELPKQRNYNLAFATTDVVTQFDFDFANQLYQRYTGAGSCPYVNPGMGALVKFALKDLFEDYQLEGGFRFSFNSKSTEYFLSLENRKNRLDKKYVFERVAMKTSDGISLFQGYIHQAKYILKYPLNEVASVRGTFNLRYDRTVTESTDAYNLQLPDEHIIWNGAKLEFIYDNTISKGLNLYNGLRYKLFAEYYKELSKSETDITIIGLDARHYLKIHRDLIWANRLSASTSLGSRKLVYYMGSVDNWIVLTDIPRCEDTQVATDQNYYFQTLATPLRGFIQNKRNGNSFVLINSELRLPVFKYLLNRPIKSDFVSNFQVIAFGDIGTAWNGKHPWSEDNAFNEIVYDGKGNMVPPGREPEGPMKITIKNQKEPIVGGYGLGVRSRLWGYFIRLDYAWGVEDGVIQKPILYFSLGLDF